MKRGVKTRNGGKWTEARFKSFIISSLRNATLRWGPKWAAIDKARVGRGINPKTGKKCILHRCELCGGLFPKGEMRADHREPVVDPCKGFVGWDAYISRMFVEAEGFQAICDGCHRVKTAAERQIRTGSLPLIQGPRRRRGEK